MYVRSSIRMKNRLMPSTHFFTRPRLLLLLARVIQEFFFFLAEAVHPGAFDFFKNIIEPLLVTDGRRSTGRSVCMLSSCFMSHFQRDFALHGYVWFWFAL